MKIRQFSYLSSLIPPPRILRVLCLLCLHILGLSSSSPKTVVIGVLAIMRSPTKCTQIIPSAVYTIESLQWTVDIFNQNNYTENTKLEIDVVDICEPKSSIIRIIKLINKYKTGPKKLIGILSITTSEKMSVISWFLGSLPPESGLIQIGTTETATQLNNRARYPTFFRVIPDDSVQIQLMVKLLKKLKWNYIAILHEKDIYGIEGAELLSNKLASQGITLAVKLAIDDINEQLFILSSDYPDIKGVVIIALSWTLSGMKEERARRYRFILTEAAEVDNSFNNLKLFEWTLSVKNPQVSFPDIERHWRKLFTVDHMKENKAFRQMIEQSTGCLDVFSDTCNLTQAAEKLSLRLHKDTLLPKIVGLYTFAFLIKKKIKKCNKPLCQPLILKPEDIKKQKVNFSDLSKILNHSHVNPIGEFNEQGNLFFPDGFRTYEIYNNLRKVGHYDGNELILNTSSLRNLEMWGVCPPGKNCRLNDFPQFLYKKGDIMLFGIVPVRSGHDAFRCPGYKRLSSLKLVDEQLAEAMIYAVEQLNQGKIYKNLFAGKKVGIVIMDSCNEQIPTFKSLLSFWQGTADICKTELNCKDVADKTLVYIGGLASDVSARVTQLMVGRKTILISYSSTSSLFRDPQSNVSPNLIRLPPSNNLQIAAMIDICVKMKWFYISMIYANNVYGLSAQRELLSKAKHYNICVTLTLPFKKGDLAESFVAELKRRPDAKVVIVFINSEDLEPFMMSFTRGMEEQDFTFLASEAWGRFLRIDEFGEKIVGSLSLEIDIPSDPVFEDYLKQKQLSMFQDDEWRQAAMESQCYIPSSLNKLSNKQCRANITLKDIRSKNQWSPLVIQSVYAAAVGLNMSISEICDKVEVCSKLFQKTEKVIEIFKGVKLKGKDGNEKSMFNKEGDGTFSYTVHRIKKIDKKFVYNKIGNWSQISGLAIDTAEIDIPPLQCPNSKRCSECEVIEVLSSSLENSTFALIGFGFLLPLLLVTIFIYWKFLGSKNKDNIHTKNDDLPSISEFHAAQISQRNVQNIYLSLDSVGTNEFTDAEETDPKTPLSEDVHIPWRSASVNSTFDNDNFDEKTNTKATTKEQKQKKQTTKQTEL